MSETSEALILGRPYILAVLPLVRTRTRSRGRVYERYVINVPRSLGERLNPRGERKVFLLAYITRPWVHQLLPLEPDDPIYRSLPREAKLELYYQHRDPTRRPRSRTVFIAAEEHEVRELGLDPTKPITLEDVVEKVREKLAREQAAKPTEASSSR